MTYAEIMDLEDAACIASQAAAAALKALNRSRSAKRFAAYAKADAEADDADAALSTARMLRENDERAEAEAARRASVAEAALAEPQLF